MAFADGACGCLGLRRRISGVLWSLARSVLTALVCDAVKEATFFRCSTVLVVDILRAALRNTDHLGTVPIGSGFLNKALYCAPLPGGTID